MKDLLLELFFANGEFSIENMVGETLPVDAEKDEFDSRDRSIKLTVFRNFRLPEL